jgi:hypothetical protein
VFNPDRNAVSVQRGQLRVVVEQVNDGTLTYWTARDASTGVSVWGYADDNQVQDVDVGCASPYFGSFEWNPAFTEDRFLNFHISNAFPGSSREAGRFHAVGIRAATPPVTTATITRPTEAQIVSGTTRIDVTTTGFTGSRSYVLSVDGVQRQLGTTSSNSFTLWFNTTRVANGTHTFTVRITQGGVTVQDSVSVVVRN